MANEENKTLNKKSTLLNSNHKRKYKNYDPLIWTLDQNPITNAKLLSDKYLKYTIEKGELMAILKDCIFVLHRSICISKFL